MNKLDFVLAVTFFVCQGLLCFYNPAIWFIGTLAFAIAYAKVEEETGDEEEPSTPVKVDLN